MAFNYTHAEIDELLKCRDNPEYFISNYFHLAHPKRGNIKARLYACQQRLVKAYNTNRHTVSLSARQSGTTTVNIGYVLWFALFHSQQHGVVFAEKQERCKELKDIFMFAYDHLPEWMKVGISEHTKFDMRFENQTLIRFIPIRSGAMRLKGYTINLMLWDCAGWFDDAHARETWEYSIPALVSAQCKVILSSTGVKKPVPNNPTLFEHIWAYARCGLNDFKSVLTLWDEIPERDAEWKQHYVNIMGKDQWKREFECEFVVEADGG